MTTIKRWFPRLGALLNDGGGPWGGRGSGDKDGGKGPGDGGNGDGGGPRNPWNLPPSGGRGPRKGGRGPSAMDQFLDQLRDGIGRTGGSGGGHGVPDLRGLWPWAIAGFVLLWLLLTAVHRIDPEERGVVSRLGRYSTMLDPGVSITFPAPIDTVQKVDVQNIRTIDIGSTAENSENLVLTGDQNIMDLAYSVRWNIKDPERYLFQIADPEATIQEVAESAMRAVVANFTLIQAIGPGRNDIEDQVRARMQEILDDYRSGIQVQGVAIRQADPPGAVNEAFKEVSAAQQTAESYLNNARAYAQQVTARAEGEAAQFNQVYAQYVLAPEVTRRRMYYETMEEVLSKVDKTVVEANGVTPYLPLPELKRRAQPAPGTGEGQ